MTAPTGAQGIPSGPGTFTREELDGAEPERPPSPRRRWLTGFVIGLIGGWVPVFGSGLSLIGFATLPFALTAAGSGALVGVSAMYVMLLSLNLPPGGDGADIGVALWLAVTMVTIVAGVTGTAVVAVRATRERRR
jgi:hypothetical protein